MRGRERGRTALPCRFFRSGGPGVPDEREDGTAAQGEADRPVQPDRVHVAGRGVQEGAFAALLDTGGDRTDQTGGRTPAAVAVQRPGRRGGTTRWVVKVFDGSSVVGASGRGWWHQGVRSWWAPAGWVHPRSAAAYGGAHDGGVPGAGGRRHTARAVFVRGCEGCGEVSAPAAGTARCGTQCAVHAEQIDGAVGGEQVHVRPYAALGAACGRPGSCVHGVTVTVPALWASRSPKDVFGPVVTWGTPPWCEGCRSASQGLSLTLMTILGGSQYNHPDGCQRRSTRWNG